MRIQILSLLLIFLCFNLQPAQANKRELRAGWIATVSNIDWPSRPGLPAVQQQQEFIARLDQLKYLGCNAVIVQVRPVADAFYESSFEPWSRFLTGKVGREPFPYYDPLEFMIREAHKRNMEFHAWFNPFRVLTDSRKNPNPPEHVTRKHPNWLIHYGGKTVLDPGIPEAREYVIRVIMEVVKKYDIDAVHMDDYFYPYRVAGQEFGDATSYKKYGGDFENRDDWRRNNVNLFVSALSRNIKSEKSYVKFGISPFGVWRNADKDPEGSKTRGGQTNYDDLYADVLLWQKEGWVDYCLPQLYWEHNHRLVAFEILRPWWELHQYNRHMYYGLGVYRMVDAVKPPWNSPKELMKQLRDIRENTKNPGYVFYSTSSFDKIRSSLKDSIQAFNRYIAFPPTMAWIDSVPPQPPVLRSIPSGKGTILRWEAANPGRETLRYAVYRFNNDETVDLNRNDRIIALTTETEFLDDKASGFKRSYYVVTALDRLWNESAPSNVSVTSVGN